MLHLQAASSPAIFIVLLACVLGAGFMVRFLVALTRDAGNMRRRYALRRERLHYPAGMAWVDAPYGKTAVNSADHLAIGVVRITTALAADSGRRKRRGSVDRTPVVTIDTARPPDFSAERRYRSG